MRLSTGLETPKDVMNAWITPSVNGLPTPTMVRTHPTCIYGSEQRHRPPLAHLCPYL